MGFYTIFTQPYTGFYSSFTQVILGKNSSVNYDFYTVYTGLINTIITKLYKYNLLITRWDCVDFSRIIISEKRELL